MFISPLKPMVDSLHPFAPVREDDDVGQVSSEPTYQRRWVYPVTVATLLALFGFAAAWWVYASFSSLRAARAYSAGHDLIVAEDVIDIGALLAMEERTFHVPIVNSSGRNYHINGTSDLCRCRVLTPLPLEIPAGETVALELIIRIPPKTEPGKSECVVIFITDSPTALLLRQRVQYAVR